MNMGVLGKEWKGEATGFYTQEAGGFGICRQVHVGVNPGSDKKSALF